MKSAFALAILTVAAVVALAQEAWRNQQSAGLSNSKQITVGMLIYCADWDDVTPWAQDTPTVQNVTMPYIKNKMVWKTMNPAGSEFEYNLTAGGVNVMHMPNPAATVMYWETKPWPNATRIVTYWDGHAKLTPEEAWKKIAVAMKTKVKRTAKKPLPKQKPKF